MLMYEKLGVLEGVPFGEPVKQDGSSRISVDLLPLNKYCKRGHEPQELYLN